MKKLTTEEFIKRAKEVHDNKYDYSKTNYVNKRTKVIITCPKHGDFEQNPYNHINHQGCPICAKEQASSKIKNKLTLKEFLLRAKEVHGDKYDFSLVKDFKNTKDKIEVICNRCGRHFITTPNYILMGHGCKYCEKKKMFTGTFLLQNFQKIYNNKFKYPSLKEDTLYNVNDIIEIECPEHGIFTKKIGLHLNGKGCPQCSHEKAVNTIRIDKETINKRLLNLCSDKFSYNIDEYKNTQSNMTFTCLKCGHTFKRKFNNLSHNTTCPNCNLIEQSIKQTKTTEEYIEQCKRLYGDLYDYSETIYNGSNKKVRVKCNKCGKYFEIEANSHLQGHGCPNHYRNKSIIEEEIFNFVKTLTEHLVIENYRNNKEIKELDIYVPYFKIGIELDGLYWHNELNKDRNYHLNKTIACEKENIRLIHIFEDEWIYKREIIESMLKNMFHKTETSIMARKCEIREVDAHEATVFLEQNHLQGSCGSSIKLGLYYNNELVSLMALGKSRHFIGNGKTQWELLRFCNKLNTTIIGGASKLLKYFIKQYNPQEIVSYADRRWSNGNLYNILKFTLYNKSKPNYYYVIGNKRIYRFNLRKSILIDKYNCPKEMSEHEFCLLQHWYRIYDCGCLCYVWKKEN